MCLLDLVSLINSPLLYFSFVAGDNPTPQELYTLKRIKPDGTQEEEKVIRGKYGTPFNYMYTISSCLAPTDVSYSVDSCPGS